MSDANELVSLKEKYWKDDVEPHPDVECPNAGKADDVSNTALKPENMIGVFLVIGKSIFVLNRRLNPAKSAFLCTNGA